MQFIAGVTHELRTPISVIRSVGENIADGIVASDGRIRQYGRLILDQGLRIGGMVEQTLQFAAIESGQREMRSLPLDAAQLVTDAVNEARPMIEQAGFSLDRSERGPLPAVVADPQAVRQILSNLSTASRAVGFGSRPDPSSAAVASGSGCVSPMGAGAFPTRTGSESSTRTFAARQPAS